MEGGERRLLSLSKRHNQLTMYTPQITAQFKLLLLSQASCAPWPPTPGYPRLSPPCYPRLPAAPTPPPGRSFSWRNLSLYM